MLGGLRVTPETRFLKNTHGVLMIPREDARPSPEGASFKYPPRSARLACGTVRFLKQVRL